ncbi:MAG: AarF/ABC1/UbiB kinase family protein [Synechococcales cyanobacterium K44_A2020_017]|nr:AarF/ABC1/UbiB kinase family protein [Synechococcales cyanobacterium K32_A2020_035]MBF2094015.1 AarF/ABC1/UbiB kinase family protein [Synechococcales cyanobacterium K44_A2020_017]
MQTVPSPSHHSEPTLQTVTVESQPVVDPPRDRRPSRGTLPPELADVIASDSLDEAIRYNPEAIANYYRGRPVMVFRRIVAIILPFLSFGLGVWWDRWTGRIKAGQANRAKQLRILLTQLGPAYIKVGQALSTRPDLVPPSYLEELTQLQDQLPPFPNEIAFRFIEEELGDRPEQIYAEFSDHPVAAASLGQVYKARLKTGEQVAVKVQRPGLAQRITLDLYILRQLAALTTRMVKAVRSDLVGIMDEFGARIFEEMDYTQEGHNAERFASLYGHIQDIYVPKIYWPYTQRRVLTMEWINGTKLTQIAELKSQGIDAAYLVEVGVQCSLRQLLEHGFFHADPHPGNLFATPEGKLAYLDFGMMSEVKPYQRYGLIEAVVHLVNRDFEGLGQDYIKLEFLSEDTDLTPIIPAFANVFNDALSASVAEMNFKSITDQLSGLMYEYPFRVPAYYALIIRSLVTLEGIAINIDPNFKVLSKAYPYVARRLLTDQSPELRSSLQDLLFKDGDFRWNRLENLLRNAQDSQDYDLNQVLDQTVTFLFSDRGTFIRDRISAEIVNALDAAGRNAVYRATHWLQARTGLPLGANAADAAPVQSNLEPLGRILNLLKETPGFDPMTLASMAGKLVVKPELHHMGQQIATELTQRSLARLIRELMQESEESTPLRSPQPYAKQRSLPAAHRR